MNSYINLFEYASSVLAYMGRPEMGTNLYDMSSRQMDMEEVEDILNSEPKPATIPRNKSWFEKKK